MGALVVWLGRCVLNVIRFLPALIHCHHPKVYNGHNYIYIYIYIYSQLSITRTFKGNRKRLGLSGL